MNRKVDEGDLDQRQAERDDAWKCHVDLNAIESMERFRRTAESLSALLMIFTGGVIGYIIGAITKGCGQ